MFKCIGLCWVLVVFLFRAGVDVRWYILYILYYYILYYTYYYYYILYIVHILLLYIIYYTLLFLLFFFPSSPSSSPLSLPNPTLLFFLLFFPPIFSSSPPPNLPSTSFKVYVSVFIVGYLYLLIPCLSFTGILTPHVLSEWMVEVCGN